MWKNFREFILAMGSSWKGMRLTFGHLLAARKRKKDMDIQSHSYFEQRDGRNTVLYPYETVPVPDHGRYKLHNEIEDCIVCDKCAKICPVDCIDIVPIKSPVEFGKTSDGTPKRIYAATFDIDMAKCCFCGLCTTVCPTECLTMTPDYDFAVTDLTQLNFGFGNLSESEAEARRLEWEQSRETKKPAAAGKDEAPQAGARSGASESSSTEKTGKADGDSGSPAPGFQPRMRPKAIQTPPAPSDAPKTPEEGPAAPEAETAPKPGFQPRMRPKAIQTPPAPSEAPQTPEEGPAAPEAETAPKPGFQPRMRPKAIQTPPTPSEAPKTPEEGQPTPAKEPAPKPGFQPRMRPVIPPKANPSSPDSDA